MPIYEYHCPECDNRFEMFRHMSEYKAPTDCECGAQANKVLSAPYVIEDIKPYRSVVTGERIKGRSHHREHLRQHELVEVGNEPVKQRKDIPMPDLVPDIKRAIQQVN